MLTLAFLLLAVRTRVLGGNSRRKCVILEHLQLPSCPPWAGAAVHAGEAALWRRNSNAKQYIAREMSSEAWRWQSGYGKIRYRDRTHRWQQSLHRLRERSSLSRVPHHVHTITACSRPRLRLQRAGSSGWRCTTRRRYDDLCSAMSAGLLQ
jgi:hypothetical protein